jgi:hypothetical protein
MGDTYSDCVAAIRAKSPGYVFAGTTIQYTANVTHHMPFQNVNQMIASAVSGILSGVSVTNDAGLLGSSANVTVTGISNIDRNDIGDIQGDITQAIGSGFTGVTVNSSNIGRIGAPSEAQICGQAPGGNTTITPPPPGLPPSANWWDSLVSQVAAQFNVTTAVAMAILVGGGIAVFMFVKGR